MESEYFCQNEEGTIEESIKLVLIKEKSPGRLGKMVQRKEHWTMIVLTLKNDQAENIVTI